MPDEKSPPPGAQGGAKARPRGVEGAEYHYTDEDGNPVEVPPSGLNPDEYEVLDVSAAPAPAKAEPEVYVIVSQPTSSRVILLCSLLSIGLVAGSGIVWWVLTRDSRSEASPRPSGKPTAGPTNRPPAAAPVTVAVEAESGTNLIAPFRVAGDEGASGKSCLTLPAKSCADGQHVPLYPDPADPRRIDGSAQIPFEVGTAGDYFLWIRKWWCCAEGNLFIVEVDGGQSHFFGNEAANFRQWSWLQLQDNGQPVKFTLPPGKHVLLVRSAGKSGFRIDQVLFTTDPTLTPTGAAKVGERVERAEPPAPPAPALPAGPSGGPGAGEF